MKCMRQIVINILVIGLINQHQISLLEERTGKGIGIVNNIMALVKKVPIGWRRVKSGLILKQAMLINGILFNKEALLGVKEADIEVYEKVDESLLRSLTKGYSKGHVAALYGELGQTPFRYISRIILYLRTVQKRDQKELTNKFFKAHEKN